MAPPGAPGGPALPAASKLKLVWNSAAPPAHNSTVRYDCDAGTKYNRFTSDFTKNKYYLTCLEENTFSSPDWPTCADGE